MVMVKMVKSYYIHKKKHPEHYDNIKDKWEEFERKYWEKHPDEKYCHICGERKNVELHHIIPRHVAPDKIFDEDNLIPLCRACHFRWGHLCNWDDYNPHVREDAKMLSALISKRRKEVKNGGDWNV